MFTQLKESSVLIKTTSGYKELDLFVRNSTGHVYAKHGQYYIALLKGGITSNAKISWTELDGLSEMYDNYHLISEK